MYLFQIPVIIFVLFFVYYNCLYIIDRFYVHNFLRQSIKDGLEAEEMAFRERHEFIDLQGWLNYNEYDDNDEIKINQLNTCKGMILKVPSSQSHDNQICRKLGGRKCGRYLERVVIPLPSSNNNIRRFYYGGGILIPGCTYCLWKQPEDQFCDPLWGYLQYSFDEDRWKCRSHLPGLYDATTNRLTACEPGGTLVKITNGQDEVIDLSQMTPQDFFIPLEEQEKYICRCSLGYISNPEISRSACFRDPCLVHLPSGVITAPGYSNGLCDCGQMYTNLHGNKRFPCTACPDPEFDEERQELTIWMKCASDKKNIGIHKGSYPCLNFEDIQRGCARIVLKAKFISKNELTNYENHENFFHRFIKFTQY